jgi:purine-binding chemotaxis protein CheW
MNDSELYDDEDEIYQENKYLLCKIKDEDYGIRISYVQSIEEMRKIVQVPEMPPFVKGIINLRGTVIPVIDLRLKFNMPERDYDDRTCTVITRIGDAMVGLIVDTVSEVETIPDKDVDPPPRFHSETEGRERYVGGIGKVGEEVKILLDVDRLIEDEEIEHLVNAAEA